MLSEKDLDYFKNGKVENEKFWRRLGFKPDLRGKTVLDFGCGLGSLAIEMAEMGAKKVVAIDLEDDFLNFAKENLNQTNFSGGIKFYERY